MKMQPTMTDTILTESTSKRLKRHLLLAGLLISLGCFTSLGSLLLNPEDGRWLVLVPGATLLFAGMVLQVVTRCRIWWNHA